MKKRAAGRVLIAFVFLILSFSVLMSFSSAANAWEKLGELVMQYLSKGRRVLVQGRLRQDRWDDKESGKKQSRVEVTASDVTFLDGPTSDNTSDTKPKVAGKKTEDVVIEDIDDKPIDLSEIPF